MNDENGVLDARERKVVVPGTSVIWADRWRELCKSFAQQGEWSISAQREIWENLTPVIIASDQEIKNAALEICALIANKEWTFSKIWTILRGLRGC